MRARIILCVSVCVCGVWHVTCSELIDCSHSSLCRILWILVKLFVLHQRANELLSFFFAILLVYMCVLCYNYNFNCICIPHLASCMLYPVACHSCNMNCFPKHLLQLFEGACGLVCFGPEPSILRFGHYFSFLYSFLSVTFFLLLRMLS